MPSYLTKESVGRKCPPETTVRLENPIGWWKEQLNES